MSQLCIHHELLYIDGKSSCIQILTNSNSHCEDGLVCFNQDDETLKTTVENIISTREDYGYAHENCGEK